MQESKERAAQQKFENDVLTAVVEASEVEIPEVMIEEETDIWYVNLNSVFSHRDSLWISSNRLQDKTMK